MSTSAIVRGLGRVLLSGIFIAGGADAFQDPASKRPKVEDLGVPKPERSTQLNGATMIAAGAAMALGIKPRIAAAVLAASLVPTTLAGHPFWKLEGQEQALQQVHFMKNLGLLGGLLWVASGRARQ